MIKFISKLSDIIDKIVCFVVIILTLFLSGLMAVGVFYRYVLNNAIYWSGEVSRYIFVYITFLGATVAYKRGAHVGIDIIIEKFNKKLQKLINLLITLCFLVFWLIILIKSFKLYPLYIMQKTATLEIPYAIPFTSLPLCALIWIIHSINEFFKQVKE